MRGAGAPTLWYSQDHGITYLSFSLLITQHLPTHALAAPHYVDIDHRNICCVRIRVSTPESQHPLRHNILNGLQIFTIPRMMSCDHKKPHFRPRRQYFRPTRDDNTSGRHVAHVAPHYNRSLQSANRNARFFSKQPIRIAHNVPSLF